MTELYKLQKFINQNIRTNGRFPSLQDICSSLNYSEEQARKFMESMAEDGVIERVGSWYRFPEVSDMTAAADSLLTEMLTATDPYRLDPDGSMTINGMPEAGNSLGKRKRGRPFGSFKKKEIILEEVTLSENKQALPPKEYKLQIKIIQIAMGLVGIGAAIINIYYTSTWSLEFLPWPLAFLLSFIMVSFTVFAFEVIVVFASGAITDNKIIKSAVCGGFTLLWIIAILFSTSNTIAGQVNKQFKNIENKSIASNHNIKEQWRVLQDQKQDTKQRLSDYRDQIKTYNQVLSGMNSIKSRRENKRAWDDVNYKLQKTQKDMAKISDEMDNIRVQEQKVLEESKEKGSNVVENTEKTLNFFEWLAKALNIPSNKIQLFLAVLPAAFCELVAPFGMAVALFLRNK